MLLDHLPVAVFEEQEGRRRFTPSRFAAIAGRPVGVWLTREQHLSPVHPDDLPGVLDELEHADETGEAYVLRYRLRRQDGTYVWVEETVSDTIGGDGEKTRRLGVAIDVTVQHTTRVRFEKMISHLPAAVGLLDTTRDEVIYVSDYIETLTGEPASYWMRPGGRQELVRRANREDVPATWGDPVLSGTRFTEFRWTRPDGEVRWFRNYATHLPDTDGVVQTMTFDITGERRAHSELAVQEERYQTLVENIPVATFINTVGGDVRFISPQIEQITGFTPAEWANGSWEERLARHYHPDDQAEIDSEVRQLRRGEIEMYERESRLRAKQGGWRVVVRRARRVTLVDSSTEVHGVLMDVTETREAQRQSRDALNALITAGEAEQSRIAAELHDDTLQVLVASMMRIRMAAARGTTDDQLEAIADTLEQATDRARRLMFELRPEVLKREGLAAALEELAKDGPWEHADVQVDVPRLSEDTEALAYRTVRELVLNARKHSNASLLTISGHLDGSRLVMVVADNGVGFDPDVAFDRGVNRLHIGIATTFERVSLVGGEVQVASAPGEGARFTIVLPTYPAPTLAAKADDAAA